VDQKDSLIFEVEAELLAVRLDSFDMGFSERGRDALSFRRPNSIRTSFPPGLSASDSRNNGPAAPQPKDSSPIQPSTNCLQ
jgi:hypothetical protein